MQGKRMRALDSRGRPVPGLYVRDGRFIAGYKQDGRWTMTTLDAETLTDARRERESLLAGLREGRIAARTTVTFGDVFGDYQASRRLSERTMTHERQLLDCHLGKLKTRRVQEIGVSDVAAVLRAMSDTHSAWTCVAVHRIMRGTFAHGVRRGILTRNPTDGLAPSERPKARNKRKVAVLDPATIDRVVMAAGSERWRVALALAGYAGLRIGEVRGLRWADVDFKAGSLSVERAMSRDGTPQRPKTQASVRTVPILPALRRHLLAWKVRSPRTRDHDLVIATADATPVQERDLRRALKAAKKTAGLEATSDRLSFHSLRHSCLSMFATDMELPTTTLARLAGHADAGFTLKVYARDSRDETAVVKDVLARAAQAKVGG